MSKTGKTGCEPQSQKIFLSKALKNTQKTGHTVLASKILRDPKKFVCLKYCLKASRMMSGTEAPSKKPQTQ